MQKRGHLTPYILFDFISAGLSWALFYTYRKIKIEPAVFGYEIPVELSKQFFLAIIIIPAFWIFLYYFSGSYKDIYRKSRLKELGETFLICLTGVIILFFALLLDDVIVSYKSYYQSFLVLFSLQFVLSYIPRLINSSIITQKIRSRRISFKTLIVGGNENALEIFREIELNNFGLGNRIIGFVSVNSNKNGHKLSEFTTHLGDISELKQIVQQQQVEEVIVALDSSEQEEITGIMYALNEFQLNIKAIPDMHDILTGKVRIRNIYGTPLIQISGELMPVWQANLKRLIDIAFSLLALVILSPLIVILIIGVKTSSKGPVFFRQERIGRYGKSFTLVKFRSMFVNAENNGPELSRVNDQRLTSFGKFMRKRKFDEIPNFWNVLKGEMSLIGPRPERQYFIDLIVDRAPQYIYLQKVKPGITSWGQVKYGYAENVDEMVLRLKYDLLYIENMSLFVDFQIMIFTIHTLIRGKHV